MPRKPDIGKKERYNAPFPSNLRRIMEEKGITQQVLADAIGVKRQMITSYQDGTSMPNCEKLRIIAETLNVSSDFLLGSDPVPNRNGEIRDVCRFTGLSESAVIALNSLKKTDNQSVLDVISKLIYDSFYPVDSLQNGRFLLRQICNYVNMPTTNAKLGYYGDGNIILVDEDNKTSGRISVNSNCDSIITNDIDRISFLLVTAFSFYYF